MFWKIVIKYGLFNWLKFANPISQLLFQAWKATVQTTNLERNIFSLASGPFVFHAVMFGFVSVCLYMDVCVQVQAELKKRFWKWQTQSYLRYSKRRRTLFAESSTVTQISVLDKSSPKDQPVSETHALTPNNVSTV